VNKKAVIVGLLVLFTVLILGYLFRNQLKVPASLTHLQSTNWLLAVPCLLMLGFIVFMGYYTERKQNR